MVVAPELTADDPHVEPFASAPPDVVYISGFEQGILVAPSLGTITGAGFSVVATNPRSGNYCLHLVAPASTAETIAYSQYPSFFQVRMRVGVKVSARPSAGSAVLFAIVSSTAGTLAQVTVSSAGVLSVQCGTGTVQAGPTIDTVSWHYVELQCDGRTTAATCDWRVDGVAQTRATGTIATGGNTGIVLGQPGTTGPAFTCDYDDVIAGPWTAAATDWYGNGYILAQQPGSDGTHATVADFSPGDAGTLYSGTVTNAWTQVAKTPPWSTTRSTTSCLGMRVVNTNAYLEIFMAPTTVSGVSANAVQPWISYSSATTAANAAAVTAYNSALGTTGALQGTIGASLAGFNTTTNTIKTSTVPILKPAAGWTAAEVNAVRVRFGGGVSSDISPVPTLQALMIEVDWPGVPGGGPPPAVIPPLLGVRRPVRVPVAHPSRAKF